MKSDYTIYDFKVMPEETKTKSSLNSIRTSAKCLGNFLFFYVYNDGDIKGMQNGMHIQDINIDNVSSERCNPVLANVMAQLDYMEKRGSGFARICNETKALAGYTDELKPTFNSTPAQFQTVIYASPTDANVGDHDGDVLEIKLTERQQVIISLIKDSPSITAKQMSETLSVSQRTIERDLSTLKERGVLKREGKDNDGKWTIKQ